MPTAHLLSERPKVRFRTDGRRELLGDLVVDLGQLVPKLHGESWASLSPTETTVLTIPKGFVYDGASIPWWAYPLMGAKERYEVGGVVHDFLYREQAPRRPSDNVFWIIARSGTEHVGPVLGWLGWAGLRVGGWWSYWKHGD